VGRGVAGWRHGNCRRKRGGDRREIGGWRRIVRRGPYSGFGRERWREGFERECRLD